MPNDPAALIEALRDKTALLLKRERELFDFRQLSDRIRKWLQAFYDLTFNASEMNPMGILAKWVDIMTEQLGFQAAAVFQFDGSHQNAAFRAGEPASRFRDTMGIEPEMRELLAAEKNGLYADGAPSELSAVGEDTGLEMFHWFQFSSGDGGHYLLIAGNTTDTSSSFFLSESDRDHFGMCGNHLAVLMDNAQLISAVRRDRANLEQTNTELDTSLKDLRTTQEELITSTRLASVGAMAGRTAHEILNPVTSIQGRLMRMMEVPNEVFRNNIELLEIIVDAWQENFDRGGIPHLCKVLSEQVTSPVGRARTLFEDDLDSLRSLHEYLRGIETGYSEGFRFLLKEVDRVVRIVDGMRSLTRRSGTASRVLLRPVLEESGESLSDSLEKRNILLHIECNGAPELFLDRYELIQVLTNLMRNAMLAIEDKSARRGGVIQLHAKQVGNKVEIRVMDSGTGILEAHQPYIFESDFTLRSADSGTGLGLGIARRLIRGAGGEIYLEHTEVGVGTTFLIELPAYIPGTENENDALMEDRPSKLSYT